MTVSHLKDAYSKVCSRTYAHKLSDNEFVFNVICNGKFAVSQNGNLLLCKIKHASFHMLLFFFLM